LNHGEFFFSSLEIFQNLLLFKKKNCLIFYEEVLDDRFLVCRMFAPKNSLVKNHSSRFQLNE